MHPTPPPAGPSDPWGTLPAELLLSAVHSSTNGILVTDCRLPDNPIVFVNDSAAAMAGYTAAEMLGKNCRFLQREDRAQPALDRLRRALAQGEPCTVVLRNYRRDGTRFLNELEISPVRDAAGRVTHFIGVQTDVTEREEARAALLVAKEAAEAANRAKDDFLAMMSHEIRTPLQCIFGYTELLAAALTNEEQRRRAAVIQEQNQVLAGVIGNILDFSRLNSGAVEFESETFSPSQLVRQVLEANRPRVGEKPLHLREEVKPDVPASVQGDAFRFRQILSNLVVNALKFTERGEILLSLRVDPTRSTERRHWLVATVTDSGIGIAPEGMARLFQPFSQADVSIARRYGGSGLGLAICRRLCERLGGEIVAESDVGRGSRFTVRLPFDAAPGQPFAPSETAAEENRLDPTFAASHPLRLLVVDDHDLSRETLCSLLKALGYAPVSAASAAEARQRLAESTFDLLLLDMQMPGESGPEFAHALHETAGEHVPRIVGLTAGLPYVDGAAGAPVLFQEWLLKPAQIGELRAMLRRSSSHSRSTRPSSSAAKPAASAASFSSSPDWRALHQLPGRHGLTMLEWLVWEFVRQHRIILREVRQALAADDLVRADRRLHDFAGTFAVLGGEPFMHACRGLLDAEERAEKTRRLGALQREIELLLAKLPPVKAPAPG